MIHLPKSVSNWDTLAFKDTFKSEVESLDAMLLPLQAGLSQGSSVCEGKVKVVVLGVSERANNIYAKAGIFYSSVIAGCNCADDPTPVEAQNEYCELRLDIDKATAETTVALTD